MNEIIFIKKIKPFKYNEYSMISSREKLVVYAINYLELNKIDTSFNNVCIASFKLFPDKFCFSENFKEYPHIEMLNRTLLHLRPKENNYATGSSRLSYKLTPLGKEIARQVKSDIKNIENDKKIEQNIIDIHKNEALQLYHDIKKSDLYISYKNSNKIDEFSFYKFLKVTPFTQEKKIKKILNELIKLSNNYNDHELSNYAKYLKNLIQSEGK